MLSTQLKSKKVLIRWFGMSLPACPSNGPRDQKAYQKGISKIGVVLKVSTP